MCCWLSPCWHLRLVSALSPVPQRARLSLATQTPLVGGAEPGLCSEHAPNLMPSGSGGF